MRISDELWDRASEIAAENGESMSDVVRRGIEDYLRAAGVVIATVLVVLGLTACGSAQPTTEDEPSATQSVVDASPGAQGQGAATEQPATESEAPEVETVPVGLSQHVESGTMRVVRIEPGEAAGTLDAVIEVSTTEHVIFDGTYSATDAAGTEYAGTPAIESPGANGIGGWFVTFTAPEISMVTYVPTDGTPVSWTTD